MAINSTTADSASFTNRLGKTTTFTADIAKIDRLCELKKEKKDNFPKIGIFVVSYNASRKLAETIARIHPKLSDVIEEIFIFDDASTDDTFDVARELLKSSPLKEKLNIFKNPTNRGYGGNQKIGYRYAIDKGIDAVVLLHGDGQYAPEFLADLMLPIVEADADVVFGSRMIHKLNALRGGMPLYKWFGNQVLTKFENIILGLKLSEYHTGYRVYSTRVLSKIPFEENTDDFHFDSQIIVQLRALSAEFNEVPIKTFYGDETCHVDGIKYAKDVIKSVILYRLHQLHIIRRSSYLVDHDFVYTQKRSPYSSHEKILSFVKKEGKALDLGSSNGLLTERLTSKGVSSVGVDIVDKDKVTADFSAYHQCNLEEPDSLSFEREFDYVIMADIIEHIRNAPQLLKWSRAFLKPNGRLVLSTPNIAIWIYRLSLLIGRFNYGPKGILDETHVKLYTLDTIRQLLERNGYVITRESHTGLPFEVVFESVGKSKVLRFIDWAYHRCVTFWPRMFAYQFVIEAKISGYESNKGEGKLNL